MHHKLTEEVEIELNNLALGKTSSLTDNFKVLVRKGYVTITFSGGWVVTSKGIKYFKDQLLNE